MKSQFIVGLLTLLLSLNLFSQSQSSKGATDNCTTKIAEVENLLFADGSVKEIPKFITKNEAAVDFCSSRKGGKVKAFLQSGQALCKDVHFTKDKFQYGSCILKVLKIVLSTHPDSKM